jgi:hypothetical protein
VVKAQKLQQQADDIEEMLSKENSDISAAVTMFAQVKRPQFTRNFCEHVELPVPR